MATGPRETAGIISSGLEGNDHMKNSGLINISVHVRTVTALFVLVIFGAAAASAQETPAPVSPAPAASPTWMDRQYDGALHVELAPYVWLPTVHGDYQYSIPTIPGRKHGVVQSSVAVTPADYAANLNSAAMFSFDARKGNVDLFGDYI